MPYHEDPLAVPAAKSCHEVNGELDVLFSEVPRFPPFPVTVTWDHLDRGFPA